MSYEAALEEVYASGDESATVLLALELSHPGFVDSIHWVMGVGEPVEDVEDVVSLPLAAGEPPVDHVPCSFEVLRPGAEKNGPTEGRIRIGGISAEAYPLLKEALGFDEAISVVLREYIVGPAGLAAIVGPDSVVEDLELTAVELDGGVVEGGLNFPDGRNLNIPTGPNAFFDRGNYPALFT